MGDIVTQPPVRCGTTARSIGVMLESAGNHAGCRSVSGSRLRLTHMGKPARGIVPFPSYHLGFFLLDAAEADRMHAGRSRAQR